MRQAEPLHRARHPVAEIVKYATFGKAVAVDVPEHLELECGAALAPQALQQLLIIRSGGKSLPA